MPSLNLNITTRDGKLNNTLLQPKLLETPQLIVRASPHAYDGPRTLRRELAARFRREKFVTLASVDKNVLVERKTLIASSRISWLVRTRPQRFERLAKAMYGEPFIRQR